MYNNIALCAFVSLFMLTACGGGSGGNDGTGTGTNSSSLINNKSSAMSHSSVAASTISSVPAGQDVISSSSKVSSVAVLSSSLANSSSVVSSSNVSNISSVVSSIIVANSSRVPASSVASSTASLPKSASSAVKSSVANSSITPSSASSVAKSSVASSANIPSSASSIVSSSSVISSSAKSSSVASSIPTTTEQWIFRGTPNSWGKTPMTWTGSVFVTCQLFAEPDSAFKISNALKKDWDEAYPSSNYSVAKDFSYDITFNSVTHAITVTKRTSACGVASSSSAVASSSSSLVPSSVSSSSVVSSVMSSSSSSRVIVSSSSVAVSSSSAIVASSAAASSSSKAPHQPGSTCLNCHIVGGEAEAHGVFTAGITLFKSNADVQPDATIVLTGTNPLITLKNDGNGNYYTSEVINFRSSFIPVVRTATNTKQMHSTPPAGTCNSCHSAVTID